MGNISPCNHEEVDYRSVLHCYNMSNCELNTIMITTADTDVVTIIVSCFNEMDLNEFGIKFGNGENMRCIPVHEIASSLGPERSKCLSLFHRLTRCDQVTFFATCGKKTAWKTWKLFPELTNALIVLHRQPTIEDVNDNMAVIERFICLMYHSATSKIEVNKCRRHLFTRKGRPLEGLPPTAEALYQHTLRVVYQGGFVLAQTLAAIQNLPKPEHWMDARGKYLCTKVVEYLAKCS